MRSDRKRDEQTTPPEPLGSGLTRYGRPEIFNTDQGSQFTSQAFTSVPIREKIAISMGGRGAWRDNVIVERLSRSVKYEEVYLHAYGAVSEACGSIGRYLSFYNSRRPPRAWPPRRRIKRNLTTCRCW